MVKSNKASVGKRCIVVTSCTMQQQKSTCNFGRT